MPDGVIRVRDMRFWGRHGVTDDERSRPQELLMDVAVVVDCAPAAASDRIDDAVDYERLYRICEHRATQESFALLEALAAACLDDILRDPRVERATVRVRKPELFEGATPEVEITRDRAARR